MVLDKATLRTLGSLAFIGGSQQILKSAQPKWNSQPLDIREAILLFLLFKYCK